MDSKELRDYSVSCRVAFRQSSQNDLPTRGRIDINEARLNQNGYDDAKFGASKILALLEQLYQKND